MLKLISSAFLETIATCFRRILIGQVGRIARLFGYRFQGSKAGSVSTFFAIGCIPLVIVAGAAIDYSRLAAARDRMQSALDAATLYAANDASANWLTTAQTNFSAQVGSDFTSPSSSFTKAANGTVTATASYDYSLAFAGLIGSSTKTIAVSSTATAPTSATPVCILLKSTSAYAFTANSGANINAPDCQIDVASAANPAAVFNASTSILSKKFCIGGSSIINNGGTHPNLALGCTAATDPFAGVLPTPASSTCTYSNLNYNGGSVTMSPGVYCGWVNFNSAPNVTFNPGVYVIKGGGWNVNGGTWTGSDVTFYMADTSVIQFNSAVNTTLSAPTSGTYSGLLLYEAMSLANSSFILNTAVGHNLTGLIYLPSRNITLNSGANVSANSVTLVANTLMVNTTTWSMTPNTAKKISAAGSSSSSGGSIFLSN